MAITIYVPTTVELTQGDIANALMQIILERTGVNDGDDSAWRTHEGNTFIGENWQVSNLPGDAILVDAYNILKSGHAKRF